MNRYFHGSPTDAIWLKCLQRRSQRDHFCGTHLDRILLACWLPIQKLHLWPDQRFAINCRNKSCSYTLAITYGPLEGERGSTFPYRDSTLSNTNSCAPDAPKQVLKFTGKDELLSNRLLRWLTQLFSLSGFHISSFEQAVLPGLAVFDNHIRLLPAQVNRNQGECAGLHLIFRDNFRIYSRRDQFGNLRARLIRRFNWYFNLGKKYLGILHKSSNFCATPLFHC